MVEPVSIVEGAVVEGAVVVEVVDVSDVSVLVLSVAESLHAVSDAATIEIIKNFFMMLFYWLKNLIA